MRRLLREALNVDSSWLQHANLTTDSLYAPVVIANNGHRLQSKAERPDAWQSMRPRPATQAKHSLTAGLSLQVRIIRLHWLACNREPTPFGGGKAYESRLLRIGIFGSPIARPGVRFFPREHDQHQQVSTRTFERSHVALKIHAGQTRVTTSFLENCTVGSLDHGFARS